jgi:hypothetical protein
MEIIRSGYASVRHRKAREIRDGDWRIQNRSGPAGGPFSGHLHRFFESFAGFLAAAREEMSVVEGDVDARVAHLIADVCCRLTVFDQLTREEVTQIMEARSHHLSARYAGHSGRPGPLGLPVLMKLTKYACIVLETS